MKAILYTRVSTSLQEREGTSLESQLDACRKYAKKHKYQILEHISDTHSGADLYDRPGVNKVRDLLKARQAQVLVVYAIDRLSRNPVHLLILLEEASRASARIEFVTERMEDSAEWKLIQYVKSYAAELEREKIKERTMRGMRQRLLNGRIPHATVTLYGYVLNKQLERREIFEPEAEIVRRVFRETAAGKARVGLANALNAEGVPPPSYGKMKHKNGRMAVWQPSAIRRMIEQPAYYGEMRGFRWKQVNGVHIERPLAEQFKVSAELCPPIISEELWRAANQVSQSNRGERTFNERNFVLLRGLLRCGRCNRRLTAGDDQYRCCSRAVTAHYCGAPSISRLRIEEWVWQEIEDILKDPEALAAKVLEAENSQDSEQSDIDRQRQETQNAISALIRGQQRVLKTVAMLEDPSLQELAEKQINELSRERKRLEALLEHLSKQHVKSSSISDQLSLLSQWCRKVEMPATPQDRRQVLESLGVQVTVDGKKWNLSVSLLALSPQSHDQRGRIAVPVLLIARKAA